jgi:hypothetical protein
MTKEGIMTETKISDLQLAAYLMALEYPLLRVEGAIGRKVFVFQEVPEAVVFAYYQGRDQVSARKLFGAYRDLKGLTLQAL